MRKSLPPPAVKFVPANRGSSALGPDVVEDECGDDETEQNFNDTIADVIEIGIGRVSMLVVQLLRWLKLFAIVYPSFAN